MNSVKLCALALLLSIGVFAESAHDAALKNLKFREIGPAIMGGRVDDFAVVESDPRIIYVASAAGGIFKTSNGGVTWAPIFDDQSNSSIGDIALAPSDPSILWVGTGEPNNRQSSSWGNGVYKSMDAGRTWTHLGLQETRHIGRVVIHPSDTNIVYVAALGHLWGPNKERGVFKTTDGGATWTHSLFINEDTGVSDIAMDPQSPNTLYAAAYERRRTVFGFNGGGPGGGIYKTVDGGAHWTRLTKGLPAGDIGRCAVDVSRKNPNVVYALVEHIKDGGIYRSEDKGFTWTRMSDTNPRPSYYSQLRIDPTNDQKVWVLGAPLYYTEDGGRTFRQDRWQKIHSDFHALWIDPANSDHMILGGDGGITMTNDSGRSWDYVNNVPIGQYYEIAYDMQKPYHLCGGLQDNNSWCGPSATPTPRGISNDEWITVGGGDGFYSQVDPTDANIVYAESQDGNLLRRDLRTGESRSIRPLEENDQAPRYRFQWNSPVLISAHDPKTLYYGGNHLFKTTDRGDSWERLGPDLTTGVDRDKQPILGKVPDKDMLSRHDGVQQFPCITTLSESPLRAGLIWVGTDDGNVQVTRDGGKTWNNVVGKIPGVRKGAYVSRVVASPLDEGIAYVAFDNHRSDDYSVYLYMTTNYGDAWTRITNGIPEEAGPVHVIREDPKNRNLLFAGTEFGLFLSFDRGSSWQRMKNGLPTVPVDDIQIHPRDHDLILATHGRSLWVMDDITPLEEMSDNVLASDLYLFNMRSGISWHLSNNKGNTGAREFIAPNPPYGVIVDYFLKTRPEGRNAVKITVADKAGNKIREINGAAETGINRVAWDLRYDAPVRPDRQGGPGGRGGAGESEAEAPAEVPGEAGAAGGARGAGGPGAPGAPGGPGGAAGPGAGGGGGGGGGFGFGGGRGPLVDPGDYTVTVAAAGRNESKTVAVEEDPRVSMSDADRAQRRQAIARLYAMARQADEGRRKIIAIRASLTTLTDGWKRPAASKVPDDVKKAADDLLAKVKDVAGTFETERGISSGPPLKYTPPAVNQKIGRLMGSIDNYSGPPTARQLEDINQASAQLEPALATVKKLEDEDLPRLNKMMADAGVPYVTADARPGR
ncbi:MAG TPA: hypothetical protein VKR61_24850 [Bryobacteraceae bacterium]|nr:hypothetical protein [Bryobacteraceae bacterium]